MNADQMRALTMRIYKEFDHLAWYYRIPLRRPMIVLGAMSSHLGEWNGPLRQIRLSIQLFIDHPWDVAIEIFKHELAHQYVTEVLQVDDQHGHHFHHACDKLGVADWARRATIDLGAKVVREHVADQSPEAARLLRRAEKLLSLASSANEYEALLAMQRVREIYARYNLSPDQPLKADDYDYAVIYLGKKRIDQHQSMICNILNEFFFVKIIQTHYYCIRSEGEKKCIDLIGSKPSLKMAIYVFHFLENRLADLFRQFASSKELSGSKLKTARRSFYLGVLNGFYNKLSLQRWGDLSDCNANTVHQVNPKEKRILTVYDAKVEDAFRRRFPRTRNSSWSASYANRDIFAAGREHGKNLTLNQPIEGKARNFGNLLK